MRSGRTESSIAGRSWSNRFQCLLFSLEESAFSLPFDSRLFDDIVRPYRSKFAVRAAQSGGMAERFNAPVLKTGDPQGSVGSNPTPSAIWRSDWRKVISGCLRNRRQPKFHHRIHRAGPKKISRQVAKTPRLRKTLVYFTVLSVSLR